VRQRCAEEDSHQHAAHSCGAAYSGLVGIVLANRICNLFGVGSFNGVCGHFVALLLLPDIAISGIGINAVVGWRLIGDDASGGNRFVIKSVTTSSSMFQPTMTGYYSTLIA